MRDAWKKETNPNKRMLSMILNKGPLDGVARWALRGLPDDLEEVREWQPRVKLFVLTSDFNEWWVTPQARRASFPRSSEEDGGVMTEDEQATLNPEATRTYELFMDMTVDDWLYFLGRIEAGVILNQDTTAAFNRAFEQRGRGDDRNL